MDRFTEYLASFIAVLIVLTLHEFAHAFVAYRCGDLTPKMNGRLTLNPLKHFDLTGLVMFVIVGFGWAKPVPINPYNFKKPRSGVILTSAAGIVMNYVTAFLVYPLFILAMVYMPQDNALQIVALKAIYLIFAYSLSFAVFNFLPFYPLDGFNLLDGICRGRGAVVDFLRKYGYYILMALIIESFLCDLFNADAFDILGYIMNFAVGIIGRPITAFWSLIF